MDLELEAIMLDEESIEYDLLDDLEVDNILQETSDVSDNSLIEDPLTELPHVKSPIVKTNRKPQISSNLGVSPTKQGIYLKNPLDSFHHSQLSEMNKSDRKLQKMLKNRRDFNKNKHSVLSWSSIPSLELGVTATCLAVSEKYIAIGTEHSSVLAYNHEGLFVKEFTRKNFGVVSCLDFEHQERALVAGSEIGQVAIWKTTNGQCIRTCQSLHSSLIASVCLYKDSRRFIATSDISGNSYAIKYGKNKIRQKKKVTTILENEICHTFKRLLFANVGTETRDLLAVGTSERVNLYNTDSGIQFMFTVQIRTTEMTYPCISWSINDRYPTLSIAWNEKITLFEVRKGSYINNLGEYNMNTQIIALEWLDNNYMICVSHRKEIKVLSVNDFSRQTDELAFESAVVDIIPNAYNQTACNSLKAIQNSGFTIGYNEITKYKLLEWKENLEILVSKKQWFDALCFGLDVYERKLDKFNSLCYSQSEIRAHLEELMKDYVKDINIPMTHKIPNCIEFCLAIDSAELLFNEFYVYFIDSGIEKENLVLFMDSLETYIIANEIKYIPREVIGKIAGYYLAKDELNKFERILMHLDPISIDLEQMIPICSENTTILVYLYTNNMDFESPFRLLYSKVSKKDKNSKYFAYKLLWYIRLCLRGELFPDGQIPMSKYPSTLSIILSLLFNRNNEENPLKDLIEIDTEATLNVIWEAFDGNAKELVNKILYEHILKRIEEEIKEHKEGNLTLSLQKWLILKEIIRDAEQLETIVLDYIEKLCILSKSEVLPFLKTYPKYPAEETMNICKKHSVFNAVSYLLESMGDTHGAIQVYLNILKEKDYEDTNSILRYMHEVFLICKRCGRSLNESENIELWFPILKIIFEVYEQVQATRFNKKISEFISLFLESMIDYVAFDKIISFIDESIGDVSVRHFKDFFVGVLSKISYHTNIVKSANSLLNKDILNINQQIYTLRNKAFSAADNVCVMCLKEIGFGKNSRSKIALFMCGHIYHEICATDDECSVCVHPISIAK